MATIEGTFLSETLTGTRKDDELWGRQGDDILLGGRGNDYLDADTIHQGGGPGGAINVPGSGRNLLIGGPGADWLTAGGGQDTLYGGAGNDYLDSYGNDIYYGQGGNDTLIWSDSLIQANGGRGRDQLGVFSDLDLRRVDNDRIVDIEVINMSPFDTSIQEDKLTLAKADLLAISSTTDTLKILGDNGDTVDIVGRFKDLGVSGDFHRYRLGSGILLVNTDITDVG